MSTALIIRPPQPLEGEIVTGGLFLEANPFKRGDFRWIDVAEGASLQEHFEAAVSALHPSYAPHIELWIDEERIERGYWRQVRPKPGHTVFARVRPHGGGKGGKNILRAFLMIAIVVAASVFLGPAAFGAGGWLGLSLTGFAAAAASALAIVAVTTLGMLAVNALIPAPGLTGPGGQKDPKYQLTGSSNQFAPYQPIPRVFGKIRMYPVVAGHPYTEIEGKHQFLRMLLLVGWGPLDISDIRIGETPITAFADVQMEVTEGGPSGWSGNKTITLYNRKVNEESLTIQLLSGVAAPFHTTALNTVEISVDITLPSGLIGFDDSGNSQTESVDILVEYRVAGSGGAWLHAPFLSAYAGADYATHTATGVISFSDKTQDAVRGTGRWQVSAGQYEVRCTRQTADHNTSGGAGTQIIDLSYWTTLRSFSTDQPVIQDNVALIAIRMRASEQLNGVPDQINCLVQAYTKDIATGSSWGLSRSPARAFTDVLRRRGGESRIADSRINLTKLAAWDSDCNATAPNASEPRWTYDRVVEGGTVFDTLREIAACGRAAYTMQDGKFSVVQDKQQATPVQVITPRNSWGYSGTRTYLDQPHAYRVEFQNSLQEYKMDELLVYADGFNSSNATRFEVLQLFGATTPTFAFREARYHMAVAQLRPEEHRVNMDIENLRCTMGDRVQLAYDVMVVGSAWGRVTGLILSGANTIGFTVDMECIFVAGKTYQLRTRRQDGTQVVRTVTMTGGPGTTKTLNCTAEVTAGGTQVGDMFVFGETGIETAPMIVKKIEAAEEYNATLTLTNYDDGIYTADIGTIPPFFSFIGTDVAKTPPQDPVVTVRGDASTEQVFPGHWILQNLGVNITTFSGRIPLEGNEVQFREANTVNWKGDGQLHTVSETTILLGPVQQGHAYQVRARSKGTNDLYSNWVQPSDVVVIGSSVPPASPTGISVTPEYRANIVRWTNPTDLDLEYVEILASLTNSVGTATVVGRDIVGDWTHQNLTAGVVWYYWVRAVDFAGNISTVVFAGSGIPLSIALYEGIGADGVLTPSEKQQIIREWGALQLEKAGIDASAIQFGITTELTAYDGAYNTLNTYLNGLSPAFSDTTQNTTIVRTTWNANWESLYNTRQTLLNKIDAVAATLANWGQIVDDTGDMPDPGATGGDNFQPDPGFTQTDPGTAGGFGTTWQSNDGSIILRTQIP